MKRVRVVVTGVVQDVWFRVTTKEMADGRGLSGWVTNLPDGSVEAVFEGPSDDVDAAVAWCWQGPEAARVDDVAVIQEVPEGGQGFQIR